MEGIAWVIRKSLFQRKLNQYKDMNNNIFLENLVNSFFPRENWFFIEAMSTKTLQQGKSWLKAEMQKQRTETCDEVQARQNTEQKLLQEEDVMRFKLAKCSPQLLYGDYPQVAVEGRFKKDKRRPVRRLKQQPRQEKVVALTRVMVEK